MSTPRMAANLQLRAWAKGAKSPSQLTTNSTRPLRQAGFTLIEIMVVLVIIGAIISIGFSRLNNTKTKVRDEVRKLSVISKELRNASQLQQSTFRIVIDMRDKKNHFYSIEKADGNVMLMNDEQERDQKSLRDKLKKDAKPKSVFSADTTILKDKNVLPKGLYFEDVEYDGGKRVVKEDIAYIHFFPQGISQSAALHLSDGQNVFWTIYFLPLSARAMVYDGHLLLKDLEKR